MHQEAGVNIWEENPPHQPTTRRAALTSAIKVCGPSEDALTGDKDMHGCMALDETHRYIKINLDIYYIQIKNLYTLSNN